MTTCNPVTSNPVLYGPSTVAANPVTYGPSSNVANPVTYGPPSSNAVNPVTYGGQTLSSNPASYRHSVAANQLSYGQSINSSDVIDARRGGGGGGGGGSGGDGGEGEMGGINQESATSFGYEGKTTGTLFVRRHSSRRE